MTLVLRFFSSPFPIVVDESLPSQYSLLCHDGYYLVMLAGKAKKKKSGIRLVTRIIIQEEENSKLTTKTTRRFDVTLLTIKLHRAANITNYEKLI